MRIKLGELTMPPPRVVGTLTTADRLAAFGDAERDACDIAEVRLDKIGPDSRHWLSHSKAIEARGCPVIFTLRLAAEGGLWRRPDAERVTLFKTALENLAAIDVELQSGLLPKLANLARIHQKTLIISTHDFVKTPSLNSLQTVVMEAARYATIVKIATLITKPQDIDTLRELLAQNPETPLCVLGMGAAAHDTRTEFPKLGSCLTYGYLDEVAAPGQPSAALLKEALRSA